MREKRWSLSICTGCGGVVGLARGLAAACDCRPSHAKTGETIVVTPAQSNPELGLEGGERHFTAEELLTPIARAILNPGHYIERGSVPDLPEGQAEPDETTAFYPEHMNSWQMRAIRVVLGVEDPATPTQQPDEDQVEARCDGSGFLRRCTCTAAIKGEGPPCEGGKTCPGCSACRALRVAAAMLAPTDGDDGFIPVTPDASQIEAAQRVIDLVEGTRPACQSGPGDAGDDDFLVSVIHAVNHSDAVLTAALKRFEQVAETESNRHALAHALDVAIFVARTKAPEGDAPGEFAWVSDRLDENGMEAVQIGTRAILDKLTEECPDCHGEGGGSGIDEPTWTCKRCDGQGRISTQPTPPKRYGVKPDEAGSWGVWDFEEARYVAVGLSSSEAAEASEEPHQSGPEAGEGERR